jgi:hypothetical protein
MLSFFIAVIEPGIRLMLIAILMKQLFFIAYPSAACNKKPNSRFVAA